MEDLATCGSFRDAENGMPCYYVILEDRFAFDSVAGDD